MTDHPTGHPDAGDDTGDDTGRAGTTDGGTDTADSGGAGPQPGVRPTGTKRRRTASMRVSRPAPEPDAGAGEPAETSPENPWSAGVRRFLDTSAGRGTLIGTAIGALLLGPLAIYSVFAVAYLWRRPLRRAVARLPFGPRTTVALLIVLAGLLRETVTWISEYAQGDTFVMLWRPQLVPTLLISLGVYLAWAVGWSVALWWYRYRLGEVLLIQAGFGLVIDRLGQTMLAGLATMPLGLLLWLHAMVVSAATLGLAWLLAGDKLRALPYRQTDSAFRYAAPALLTGLSMVAIFMVWGPLLAWLRAVPDPAPIRDRPFW